MVKEPTAAGNGALSDSVLGNVLVSNCYVAVWIFLSFSVALLRRAVLAVIAFEATKLVLIQILLTSKGISLNPITSLYYVAPGCLAFLFVPWVFVELPRMHAVGMFEPDFVFIGP